MPAPEKAERKFDHLRFKADFDYARSHGNKTVGRAIVVVTAPARKEWARCGVVCGKKYSPLAVARNRARRLLWESFRHLKQEIMPVELVLIPRYRLAEMKEPEVRAEMRALLIRAGVVSATEPIGGESAIGPESSPSAASVSIS